jgi:hypothetical protein
LVPFPLGCCLGIGRADVCAVSRRAANTRHGGHHQGSGLQKISQLNMDSTNAARLLHPGVNLTDYLDQKYLPGRKYGTYRRHLDTMPAIVAALLGFSPVARKNNSVTRKSRLASGCGARSHGFLWGVEFRHQKNMDLLLCFGRRRLQCDSGVLLDRGRKKWRTWCHRLSDRMNRHISQAIPRRTRLRRLARRSRWPGENFNAISRRIRQSYLGVALFIWFAHFLYRRKIFLRL